MSQSSYQVERLIEHLRRLGDWLSWPAYRRWRGEDPVRLSRAARQSTPAAGGGAVRARSSAPATLEGVRELRRYAPEVEAERERRAGMFMEPPYPDEPPPSHIPKLERVVRRRARARPVGDAD